MHCPHATGEGTLTSRYRQKKGTNVKLVTTAVGTLSCCGEKDQRRNDAEMILHAHSLCFHTVLSLKIEENATCHMPYPQLI